MSYKSLLVHMDTSDRANVRLALALKLARTYGARLNGLFATFEPDPNRFYVMAGSSEYFVEHRRARAAQRQAVERRFKEALVHEGLDGDWLAPDGHPVAAVVQRSRAADLVIAGQTDLNDPDSWVSERFPETLVMSAGCPVLVVPYAGRFASLGERVLVAWDGSREAARALHDAMPFLGHAAHVTVAGVSTSATPPADVVSCPDIAALLTWHGVPSVDIARLSGETVGDALLSHAADRGYDLLVMGAYGHARWHEMVLGGTTRTVFETMSVPVLMSH